MVLNMSDKYIVSVFFIMVCMALPSHAEKFTLSVYNDTAGFLSFNTDAWHSGNFPVGQSKDYVVDTDNLPRMSSLPSGRPISGFSLNYTSWLDVFNWESRGLNLESLITGARLFDSMDCIGSINVSVRSSAANADRVEYWIFSCKGDRVRNETSRW